jgi:hypothetical protein
MRWESSAAGNEEDELRSVGKTPPSLTATLLDTKIRRIGHRRTPHDV